MSTNLRCPYAQETYNQEKQTRSRRKLKSRRQSDFSNHNKNITLHYISKKCITYSEAEIAHHIIYACSSGPGYDEFAS